MRPFIISICILVSVQTIAQIPTNGLVAYYPFNGNATDESGHGNNGLIQGAVLAKDRLGNDNSSYYFDGSSRIICPDLSLPFGNSPRTISAWINAGQLQNLMGNGNPPGHIVKYGVEGAETQHCNISLWGNYIRFSNWSSPPDADYGFTHPVDEWFQVVTSLDADNVSSLYINGSLVYSTSVETWNTTSSGSLLLGEYFTNGKLDDIRIYNRALTQLEISDLYNSEKTPETLNSGLIAYYPFNGNANDESGNLNHGVNYGATLVADRFGNPDKAYSFNGAGDSIRILTSRNVTGNSSRSVCAWIKLGESPNSDNTIYKGGENGDGNDFTFLIRNVYAGIIQLYVRRFNNDIWSENINYTPGQWMHVAVSYDGTNGARVKFYLNGVLKSTENGGAQTFNTVATNPVIGNHISQSGINSYFKGEIDELRIYNRALSQVEILGLVNNNIPSCATPGIQVVKAVVNAITLPDGTLPLALDAVSCPKTSGIVEFNYWFDGLQSEVHTLQTQGGNYLSYVSFIDCEDLLTGNHTIKFQFKDNQGRVSAVSEAQFIRMPMDTKYSRIPSLQVVRGAVHVGDIQKIKGTDFSSSGAVQVYIYTPDKELMGVFSNVEYLPNGSFQYLFQVDNSFQNGIYEVKAMNVATNTFSASVNFFVSNPVGYHMEIVSPVLGSKYPIGHPVTLVWKDFINKDNPNGKSGDIYKGYKIEFSTNNGSSWNVLQNDFRPQNLIGDYLNSSISLVASFSEVGTYIFRVTDNLHPVNSVVSQSFDLYDDNTNYCIRLDWDKSCPINSSALPIGLAADGVARVVVDFKNLFPSSHIIEKIKTSIESVGDNLTGIQKLGKVVFRVADSKYNNEGSLAQNSYDELQVSSQSSVFSLWYVAPQDFSSDILDERRVRYVRLKFEVFYLNNPSPEIVYSDRIEIVRPPVMWVHGLNGDYGSFTNAKYSIGNRTESFFKTTANPWVVSDRVELINYESFATNARILLGMDSYDNNYPHTFKYFLDKMHSNGYACNRVDYVCHSMGGSVARAMIMDYENAYRGKVGSYMNYDSGYIHKLITVNTPNNGSPIADFLIANQDNILLNLAAIGNDFFGDKLGFWHDKYPSPAIYDLSYSYSFGRKFNKTERVWNHLISSDVTRIQFPSKATELKYLSGMVDGTSLGLIGIYLLTSPSSDLGYINSQFGNTEMWGNSDMVVPVSSQLANANMGAVDDISGGLVNGQHSRSIIYGDETNSSSYISSLTHIGITDNILVGSRIFSLLNSSVGTSRFQYSIPANLNIPIAGKTNESNLKRNSIVRNNSEGKFNVVNPLYGDQVIVDSLLLINIQVLDTVNLKRVFYVLGNQMKSVESNLPNQYFKTKITPDLVGVKSLLVGLIYDSLGNSITYFDTVKLDVIDQDILKGILIDNTSRKMNKNNSFTVRSFAIYEKHMGRLVFGMDGLEYEIADTNVVAIDSLNRGFVTKDTGSTYILFHYKGFSDTMFVYVNFHDVLRKTVCLNGAIVIPSNITGEGLTYQWQVDSGSGFISLPDTLIYSGTTTSDLSISLSGGWINGYRFRCLVSSPNTIQYSEPQEIRVQARWSGVADDNWANPVNWECNVVPDAFTDVIIPGGKVFYPIIRGNISVNSLFLENNSNVFIAPGYNLLIKKIK